MTRVSNLNGRPATVKLTVAKNLIKALLNAPSNVARDNARNLLLSNLSGLNIGKDQVLRSLVAANSHIARSLLLNRIIAREAVPTDLEAAKIVLELFAGVKWQHQSLAQQALDTLFPKEPAPTTEPPVPKPKAISIPRPPIKEVEPAVTTGTIFILQGTTQLPTSEELNTRFIELFEKLAGELCDPDADVGDRIIKLMEQSEDIALEDEAEAFTANTQLADYRKIFERLDPGLKGLLLDPDNVNMVGRNVIEYKLLANQLKATCEILEEWEKSLLNAAFQSILKSLINVRILENLLKDFPEGLVSKPEAEEMATVTPLPVPAQVPQEKFIDLAQELLSSNEEPTDEAIDKLQGLFLDELGLGDNILIKSQFRSAKRGAQSFKEFFNKLLVNFEKIAFTNQALAAVAVKIHDIINPSEDDPNASS
jgi:hypothetical protein